MIKQDERIVPMPEEYVTTCGSKPYFSFVPILSFLEFVLFNI